MQASISVIVPTIGRATLAATLDSIQKQMFAEDEVVVVGDTLSYWEDPKISLSNRRLTFAEVEGGDRGNAARIRGMELATGTHLAFMDDDDAYIAGAFQAMHEYAQPDRITIFRMRHHPWQVIIPFENEWGNLKFGNVGTPCILVPNIPDKLGTWAPWDGAAGSDFRFISETCEKLGTSPVWRREITSIVRPHEVVLASN